MIVSDCNDGDIRLVSVSNPMSGRVEVCHDGVWGTVCNSNFGLVDAAVACKQLGYSKPGAVNQCSSETNPYNYNMDSHTPLYCHLIG